MIAKPCYDQSKSSSADQPATACNPIDDFDLMMLVIGETDLMAGILDHLLSELDYTIVGVMPRALEATDDRLSLRLDHETLGIWIDDLDLRSALSTIGFISQRIISGEMKKRLSGLN